MSELSETSWSSSSSSSFGPSTPYSSSSHRRPSSESSCSATTPPGSYRDYAASLKASHTRGMAAAMKSMPLERSPSGYRRGIDDNPFDQLFLSPTPEAKPAPAVEAQAENEEMVIEEVQRRRKTSNELELETLPFRPSLLDFHRKSDMTATPSSVSSEASFEASGPGDYFRMYGYSPIDLNAYIDQPSPLSYSFFPPSGSQAPQSPFEPPFARMSIASTSTEATITSSSSSTTITSLPSSSSDISPTATAQFGVAGRMVRPSLLRPRPRKTPYGTPGGRQRETSGGRGLSFGDEQAEMQYDGRSVSEVQVAMAGLRCQRSRAVRG